MMSNLSDISSVALQYYTQSCNQALFRMEGDYNLHSRHHPQKQPAVIKTDTIPRSIEERRGKKRASRSSLQYPQGFSQALKRVEKINKKPSAAFVIAANFFFHTQGEPWVHINCEWPQVVSFRVKAAAAAAASQASRGGKE